MTLEEMKRIAAARTRGEWKASEPSEFDKALAGVTVDDRFHILTYMPYEDSGIPIEDAEFIAMAANNIDALLAVVEAAKACREFSKTPVLSPMRMLEGEELLERLHKALDALDTE